MVRPFPPSLAFRRTTLSRHVQLTVRVSIAEKPGARFASGADLPPTSLIASLRMSRRPADGALSGEPDGI